MKFKQTLSSYRRACRKHCTTSRLLPWLTSFLAQAGDRAKVSLASVLLLLVPTVSATAVAADDGNSLLLRATLVSPAAASVANDDGLVEVAPSTASVQLVQRKLVSSPSRRLRHFQYSEDQIVVVAVDANGTELYRDVHTDPRLIRAEVTNAAGQLEYREFYSPSVSMAFSVPNDASLQSVRLLKPKWDGSTFSFEPVGVLAVN